MLDFERILLALVPVDTLATLISDAIGVIALMLCASLIAWVMEGLFHKDASLLQFLDSTHDGFIKIAFLLFLTIQVIRLLLLGIRSLKSNYDGLRIFMAA